jgi:signal transduction histidine kinase
MAGVLDAPVVAARVLIVEDDPTVAEVVARYLLREGYQVEAVADGAVGLERALADPPDLVVLDLMLPSLGGLELCRRLRAVAPVPVIMLTARGEEADRLAGLVDDLFELSRIHAGLLALDLHPVALDELIADAIAGASIAARAKGIVLAEQVDDPAPVVERSTPEMARVVRNLLDNAIRHTPAGETVVVHAALEATATQAEVWVQDGCGGIPEGDLDLVFELAYRGDVARTPGDGGAGLGLAVARGLVEAHHGDINVRNEGAGCRFTVTLPSPRGEVG